MGNVVSSFINDLVPRLRSPGAVRPEPGLGEKPTREIKMPADVTMPAESKTPPRPYRPQPQPSHWRAPNM